VSATSYDCDLAIVGAGPAGCAAALCARQTGLRVILIEKKQQCTKRQPGETLHPGIESLFAQLGVREQIEAEGFHRHRGVWVEWEGPGRNVEDKAFHVALGSPKSLLMDEVLENCFPGKVTMRWGFTEHLSGLSPHCIFDTYDTCPTHPTNFCAVWCRLRQ
jgi:2-polyprenyl-6-methoxyphenol hydroxylase-like FAD-dependent oxidoreductase